MERFVGRERELSALKELLDLHNPSLVIVKGRRRIGKSRLLQEFGKAVGRVHSFTGLPPDKGITAKDQREEFARQFEEEFGIRDLKSEDWGSLFWNLAQQTKSGRVLVILDEISWMAMDDPKFLPKLQVAWEKHFKKNPDIILALCSSISIWIEDNLLSSTGFVGRQSMMLTLKELSLKECNGFWNHSGGHISSQEKLLALAVTGGIPRYLEELKITLPVEKNIQRLCFRPEGILFREFDQIFSDLFGDKKELCRKICECLALGATDAQTIFEKAGMTGSGDDYKLLKNLTLSGFISKDYSWHLRNGEISKLAWYRLSDNYCRFYLKYILPNKARIEANDYHDISLPLLPEWSFIIGLQIENLVLNNRQLIKKALNIQQQEILSDNPYIQRATKTRKGCQIDYLIQTRFNTLYVCEIKYSKEPIQKSVIEEVQKKIDALNIKRNFSVRPVLIHCNTVSEKVLESGYFANIINFIDFLEKKDPPEDRSK